MASEEPADKPFGFAGLKSWVSSVNFAQLHVQSEKSANDPDPSSGVAPIRDRQLGRWLGLAALIVFIVWLFRS